MTPEQINANRILDDILNADPADLSALYRMAFQQALALGVIDQYGNLLAFEKDDEK